MDTRQANWPRTALLLVVLAAAVVTPWVVATAGLDNWNLADITRRMPWYDPSEGLAGDLTTDQAAAAACATVPTFEVVPDDDGALLDVDGPLSIEEANVRLGELGVALELGLYPVEDEAGHAVASIGLGPGDPAVVLALEAPVGRHGRLEGPVALPAGAGPAGLVLSCPSTTD